MKHVDLEGVEYIGAEIVDELVQQNTEQFGTGGVRFQKLNIIKDNLPDVDLILCRDCLATMEAARKIPILVKDPCRARKPKAPPGLWIWVMLKKPGITSIRLKRGTLSMTITLLI